MNKNLIIAVAAILVLGAGYLLLSNQAQGPTTPGAAPTSSVDTVEKEEATGDAMMEEKKATAVTVTASGFAPQTVTVKAGTKVVWANKSGTTVTVNSAIHPTHLVYPPLNLGSFANGQSVQLVFDKPGTYKYHNHLNPGQTGTVVVTSE